MGSSQGDGVECTTRGAGVVHTTCVSFLVQVPFEIFMFSCSQQVVSMQGAPTHFGGSLDSTVGGTLYPAPLRVRIRVGQDELWGAPQTLPHPHLSIEVEGA